MPTMAKGYSVSISAASMLTPAVLTSVANGGPIRSITVGNQTSSTTAVVYGSSSPIGTPIFAVVPGQFSTIPIQETSAISVVFVCAAGYKFDGACYLHTDTEALAASGFTQSSTAPLWVWDSSVWDGGAVWSG
jgi:hypothetical protein